MRLLFAVTAIFALLVLACSSDESQGNDIAQTREQAETEVREQIDSIDRRMAQLEQEARQQGGSLKQDIEEQLRDLRDERQTLDAKLDELRAAGEDNWRNVKEELDRSIDQINDELDEAFSR